MDGFQLSSALGLWFLQSSCHMLVYLNYLDFYGFCCTSTVYLSVIFLYEIINASFFFISLPINASIFLSVYP